MKIYGVEVTLNENGKIRYVKCLDLEYLVVEE